MLNKKIVQQINRGNDGKEYMYIEEHLENITLDSCEVLVRISCCALCETSDLGKQFMQKGESPYIPVGREISGVVESIGDRVTFCKPGDEIVGILPLDSNYSGCGNFCVISEFDIVKKPENVTSLNAACGIGDALKAYTALFYQAKIVSGETIVIASAAKGFGILATQLAIECGARVIVIGSTDEEMSFLHNLDPPANQVIDLRDKKSDIISICLEETGGIGVDIFLDDGVEMYNDEEFSEYISSNKNNSNQLRPSKYDVISSLGVSGRWVTSQHDLQMDPPDSSLLAMKCASVHFLFEHSWTLSRGAQGKYLHILNDVMTKMSKNVLRPTVHHTIVLNDCVESLHDLHELNVGRIVVKL